MSKQLKRKSLAKETSEFLKTRSCEIHRRQDPVKWDYINQKDVKVLRRPCTAFFCDFLTPLNLSYRIVQVYVTFFEKTPGTKRLIKSGLTTKKIDLFLLFSNFWISCPILKEKSFWRAFIDQCRIIILTFKF